MGRHTCLKPFSLGHAPASPMDPLQVPTGSGSAAEVARPEATRAAPPRAEELRCRSRLVADDVLLAAPRQNLLLTARRFALVCAQIYEPLS